MTKVLTIVLTGLLALLGISCGAQELAAPRPVVETFSAPESAGLISEKTQPPVKHPNALRSSAFHQALLRITFSTSRLKLDEISGPDALASGGVRSWSLRAGSGRLIGHTGRAVQTPISALHLLYCSLLI